MSDPHHQSPRAPSLRYRRLRDEKKEDPSSKRDGNWENITGYFFPVKLSESWRPSLISSSVSDDGFLDVWSCRGIRQSWGKCSAIYRRSCVMLQRAGGGGGGGRGRQKRKALSAPALWRFSPPPPTTPKHPSPQTPKNHFCLHICSTSRKTVTISQTVSFYTY